MDKGLRDDEQNPRKEIYRTFSSRRYRITSMWN